MADTESSSDLSRYVPESASVLAAAANQLPSTLRHYHWAPSNVICACRTARPPLDPLGQRGSYRVPDAPNPCGDRSVYRGKTVETSVRPNLWEGTRALLIVLIQWPWERESPGTSSQNRPR